MSLLDLVSMYNKTLFPPNILFIRYAEQNSLNFHFFADFNKLEKRANKKFPKKK